MVIVVRTARIGLVIVRATAGIVIVGAVIVRAAVVGPVILGAVIVGGGRASAVAECVRFFVRGDFSLSGSGCLSGVFSSRYLMPWFPVCARPLRNRAYRLVPGLMLRVPVIVASCSFRVPLRVLRGSRGRPFHSAT